MVTSRLLEGFPRRSCRASGVHGVRKLNVAQTHSGEAAMQTILPKQQDIAHLSDTELVALANSGSGQAFRTIMQRFNQRLYRVARGILHDEPEAEDVLQDAYVRAFAALRKFRRESSLGTWLTRIVMNEAVSRLGQRRPSDELETLDRVVERGDARVIMFPGV